MAVTYSAAFTGSTLGVVPMAREEAAHAQHDALMSWNTAHPRVARPTVSEPRRGCVAAGKGSGGGAM